MPQAAGKAIYTLREFAGEDGDIADPASRDENFFRETCSLIKRLTNVGRMTLRRKARSSSKYSWSIGERSSANQRASGAPKPVLGRFSTTSYPSIRPFGMS